MDVFAERRDMIDEQYLAVIDTETNMFDEVRRDLSRVFSAQKTEQGYDYAA